MPTILKVSGAISSAFDGIISMALTVSETLRASFLMIPGSIPRGFLPAIWISVEELIMRLIVSQQRTLTMLIS